MIKRGVKKEYSLRYQFVSCVWDLNFETQIVEQWDNGVLTTTPKHWNLFVQSSSIVEA